MGRIKYLKIEAVNMNRRKIKNKKGYTFLEVIVSVSIFVIIIAASTDAFSNLIGSYRKIRDFQESVENVQFAMNEAAKVLRTSSIVANGNSFVQAFDYSQEICVRYEIIGGQLMRAYESMAANVDPLSDCSVRSFAANEFLKMTTGSISGSFSAIPSSSVSGSEEVGKVTIMLNIQKGDADSIKLQSSVSLRDYEQAGIQ